MSVAAEHHTSAVDQLTARLRTLEQHTPVQGSCYYCRVAWPCKTALNLTTDVVAPIATGPAGRCTDQRPDTGRCVAGVDETGAHLGMHTNGAGRRWKNTGRPRT